MTEAHNIDKPWKGANKIKALKLYKPTENAYPYNRSFGTDKPEQTV